MVESQALLAECPTCKAVVPLEATECPRCGELFEDMSETGAVAVAAAAEEVGSPEAGSTPRAGFREKFLFYAGIFMILLGGPGIALGSWLHDVLRIPFEDYRAFDVFGPVNRLVTAAGLIVLIVGIVLLILSLRFARPTDVEKDLTVLRET